MIYLNITKATISDVPEAVALVNSAYRGDYSKQGWTSESHLLQGIRIDEAEMAGYFNRPEITLLKYVDDEGRMIGLVYLEQVTNNRLYLGMLTVDPLAQAAGIGRKLLEAADEYAHILGCEAIKISVITTRTELIAWYQRRGYTATGETYPLVTDKSVSAEPVTLMVMEKGIE
ncbi:GNAT family N-acetyltransferase [Mucilaginibacter terrae]|uniref:GNAT superfamily N-acetyltransferase n=1 Tax=Mucilaginibacter terrae TaxID=1955052 RepID=A0ABU3GYM8_9SPHI|nr:GNAT family N-acetyltransferase [Mucilaginibacter terrae]MDT3404881.1 GNAT superfamily N-acetyltransferase [Mucilaginibacter terrae]